MKDILILGDSLILGSPGLSYLTQLEKLFPGQNFDYHAKVGESIVTLYQSLITGKVNIDRDLILLWVGINDIFPKISWSQPISKFFMRQSWAKDEHEFRNYYELCLNILSGKAKRVVVISPLLIGEDIYNPWNNKLKNLSSIIGRLSNQYDNVRYVNLQLDFETKLKTKNKVSKYLPRSVISIIIDMLFRKKKHQVDQISMKRGLFYTIDGAHLNSRGADLILESFRLFIEEEITDS